MKMDFKNQLFIWKNSRRFFNVYCKYGFLSEKFIIKQQVVNLKSNDSNRLVCRKSIIKSSPWKKGTHQLRNWRGKNPKWNWKSQDSSTGERASVCLCLCIYLLVNIQAFLSGSLKYTQTVGVRAMRGLSLSRFAAGRLMNLAASRQDPLKISSVNFVQFQVETVS